MTCDQIVHILKIVKISQCNYHNFGGAQNLILVQLILIIKNIIKNYWQCFTKDAGPFSDTVEIVLKVCCNLSLAEQRVQSKLSIFQSFLQDLLLSKILSQKCTRSIWTGFLFKILNIAQQPFLIKWKMFPGLVLNHLRTVNFLF